MEAARNSEEQSMIRTIFVIIITLLCFATFFAAYSRFSDVDRKVLATGWTVRYKDMKFEDVDLYRFRMPVHVQKGEHVILENTIPSGIGNNKAMVFQTSVSNVMVYVNGKQIYTYLGVRSGNVEIPGNGMNSVILPDYTVGDECQIILKAGEDNAFTMLPIFFFVDAWNGSAMHMNMYIGTCLVGFFETLFGIILIFISLGMFVINRNPARVFAVGLISFAMGVWSLYDGNAMELFSSDFNMNTQLGYLCIYFALIPFSFSIAVIRGKSSNRWKNAGMVTGVVIPVAFFAIAAVLDLTGIAFVTQTYRAFILCAVLSIAMLMISTGGLGEKATRDVKIISVGIDILFIGVVVDVIRYMIKNIVIVENRILDKSILPYVSLAFILIVLYAYLVSMNDRYMELAKDQLLHKMAFTDALTGLGNRAFCKQALENLSEKRDRSYTLISLDVNGLKKINDSMGHAAGDQLIRDCAGILSDVFSDLGDVIRMGGDEFLVIIYDRKIRRLPGIIRRMEKLEKSVSSKRKYDITISYGVADAGGEDGMTPESVYREADARMYEMKKKYKMSR